MIQPPKMSPEELVSAGMARLRMESSPFGPGFSLDISFVSIDTTYSNFQTFPYFIMLAIARQGF
jgi:hypothetical protein